MATSDDRSDTVCRQKWLGFSKNFGQIDFIIKLRVVVLKYSNDGHFISGWSRLFSYASVVMRVLYARRARRRFPGQVHMCMRYGR